MFFNSMQRDGLQRGIVTLCIGGGQGIALNTGFVAIEAFCGWQINSLASLSDAGHNLSDVAGLVLAWAGALWMGCPAWPVCTTCTCEPWAPVTSR